MKYHLTTVRMATIKKSMHNKCWRGYRRKGTLLHCWWECKLIQPLWKIILRFLKKLGIKPPWREVKSLSCVRLFATPWTVAYQAPRSMEFSRQEYWSGLPFPSLKPPYDPAIPLLGIYPEETKIEKDTCTPMFIAALFTTARIWKQPRCLFTDEWIKKLWYIYTMV